MASYLLVISDRKALAWILEAQQMAFPKIRATSAQKLQLDDKLLLYSTRGCFGNPIRDRGRVIGEATVSSQVARLSKPVIFDGRTFPVGCSLNLHRLARFSTGVELSEYVTQMHAFPNTNAWSVYLRRPLVSLDDHDYKLLLRPLQAIAGTPSEAIHEYVKRGSPRRSP